jgi:hypothetical protein
LTEPKFDCRISSEEEDEMAAWLENQSFEHAQDYIQRGRNLVGVPTPEIKARWVAAFKVWAANWHREQNRELRADLEAELSIRKDRPPYKSVKNEMDSLKNAAKEAMLYLESDPRRFQEVERDLRAEFDHFAESQKTRKH